MAHFLARGARARWRSSWRTSGDTGSAVAHGFFGVPHVTVFVLYPSGRVSDLQERQMATLGGNVRAIEVEGSFDDCQRLVKRALAERPRRAGRELTTANSINIGRLLPQITYYLWGYAQWRRGPQPARRAPHVVVPSGNFGNLTAARLRARDGLPMRPARRGDERQRRRARVPAHRALRAARLGGDAVERDGRRRPEQSGAAAGAARRRGGQLGREIEAHAITDDATLREIRVVAGQTGTVLDPHTAVGVRVARSLPEDADVDRRRDRAPGQVPRGDAGGLRPRHRAAAGPGGRGLGPKQSERIPAEYEAFRSLLER